MNLWQTVPVGGLFLLDKTQTMRYNHAWTPLKRWCLKQFGSDILLLKYQNQRRKE